MQLTYGYAQGIALNATMSAFPGLWRGLAGLWCPSVGVQGMRLWDWSGRKGHMSLNTSANFRWTDGGRAGRSIWLNGGGNDYLTGPTGLLNAVQQFSFLGWWNQHVIDSTNGFMTRAGSGVGTSDVTIETFNDGNLYAEINSNFGGFDYSAAVSQQTWFHLAVVFDGGQSTDATRLKIYINGRQQTLSFGGTIPTVTPSFDGALMIGRYATNNQWLGRFDDIRLYHRALSPAEIVTSMRHSPLEVAYAPIVGQAPALAAAGIPILPLSRFHHLIVR